MCSGCGARYTRGKWEDFGNIDDIVIKTTEDALLVHQSAQEIEIYIEPRALTPYLYRARVEVDAIVIDRLFHKELETEVRIIREACDMCSRISGGYFEAIVQIRATDRNPEDNEKKRCEEIADDVLKRMRLKGDRMAFISNTSEVKEGIDLYIGSANAARHICKEVNSQLGGRFSESETLQGRKDGKDMYRVTFSLRLPKFMKSDIIEYKDKIIEIRKFGKKVTGTDIQTGARFTADPHEVDDAKLISKKKDLPITTLVAIENDDLMVLDPDTYETVTIKKPPIFNA